MRCVDCGREGVTYLQSETTGQRVVCELCYKVRLIVRGWLILPDVNCAERKRRYAALLALVDHWRG